MPAEQYSSILMIVIVFAIMYFLIIRPQQKRDKQTRAMQDALKDGDNIVTIGGITGRIVNINDDGVTIETSIEKTKLLIEKRAIREVKKSVES